MEADALSDDAHLHCVGNKRRYAERACLRRRNNPSYSGIVSPSVGRTSPAVQRPQKMHVGVAAVLHLK
jgi:hypothetical protein